MIYIAFCYCKILWWSDEINHWTICLAVDLSIFSIDFGWLMWIKWAWNDQSTSCLPNICRESSTDYIWLSPTHGVLLQISHSVVANACSTFFSPEIIKIQIVVAIFRFSMTNAFKWVQFLFVFIYNIRRIARLFPTVHYALNLRDAARNEFERNMERRYDFRCRRKPKCSKKTCAGKYGSRTKFTYDSDPTGNQTRAVLVKGTGTTAAPTRPPLEEEA